MKKEIVSRKHEIEYKWYVSDNKGVVIDDNIINELDQHALHIINKKALNDVATGYTFGELFYEIDDIEYDGWWGVKFNWYEKTSNN